MKVVILILLSVALIAGISTLFLQNNNDNSVHGTERSAPKIHVREVNSSVDPLNTDLEQSSSKVIAIPTLAKKQMEALENKTDHSLDVDKRTELEALVEKKQVEIDTLIVSLNDNLQNSIERTNIQVKLDAAIEQYNALLLPLALDKMTASVND
jgi:hypothetical protein